MPWWNPWTKKETKPQRAYQGAAYNRLTNDWVTASTSADSEIFTSLRILRNRSRELCRNNDYARGARNTLTRNIVGKGFQFQSKIPQKRGNKLNDRLNTEIEEAWQEWCEADRCHVAGKLDFVEIESLAVASIIESGEVLIRLVSQPFGDSEIPLGLEIIEPDQLADDYSVGQYGNNFIKMGVEMNEWGRPVAYHLYPYHPGDYQFNVTQRGTIRRVPASEIIHLYLCERPGQTRGLPWFYSTLMRMRQLGGYEEAELVAARAQAAVMGFIETPDGDLLGDATENGQRLNTLEPGVMEILSPGEKFSGFAPTRPGDAFAPFVQMMLRGAAVGVGLSYESYSGDYTNTSYSSARTSTMNERDQYRIIQDWIIRKLLRRVYRQWLDLASLSGRLVLPGYDTNRLFYFKPHFSGRSWQWVDPQKDIKAKTDAIAAGLETQTSVLAEQGKDIEDLLKERRHELDLAADMGLDFGGGGAPSPVPATTSAEGQQPESSEPQPVQFAEGMTPVERTHGQRAKNCIKGISCGNSCIAKSKTCKQTLSADQKPKKQKAAGKAKPSKAPKTTKTPETPKALTSASQNTESQTIGSAYSEAELNALETDHQKNLYGVALGLADTRDAETIARQDKIIAEFNEVANQEAKVKRLIEDGLTKEEADGVAVWVDGNYTPINEAIYGGKAGETDYGVGAGIRTAQGLKKLPSYTYSQLEEENPAKNLLPQDEVLLPKGQLRRGLSDVGNVDSFLQPYRDAVGKEDYKEPTFFATTARKSLEFTNSADILYIVTSKADGTGQGKAVDKYKNTNWEGEILYPPYSRFKVTKVKEAETAIEEFLPSDIAGMGSDGLPQKIPPKLVKMSATEWNAEKDKYYSAYETVLALKKNQFDTNDPQGDFNKAKEVLASVGISLTAKDKKLAAAVAKIKWVADTRKIKQVAPAEIYMEEL